MDGIPDFLNRKLNGIKPDTGPLSSAIAARRQSSWDAIRAKKKEKARGRVAKMLAIKSERDASAAGKRWDAINGGWK